MLYQQNFSALLSKIWLLTILGVVAFNGLSLPGFSSRVFGQGFIIQENDDHFHLPRPRPRPNQVERSYRIKELLVDANIEKQIATTHVTQVFENTGNQTIEATFVFPLPYDGAIDKMTFLVDGKEIEARLLPKDQARSIYEGYIRRNQDPALLEWIGTGMFRSSVFPIPPGATRTVVLRYSQLLRKDGMLVDYLFPLNTAKYTTQPLDKLSLRVAINSDQEIKNIYSPTHDITIDRDHSNSKNAVVHHLATQTIPGSDFRIVFDEMNGDLGASMLSFWPADEDQGYFVLLASPKIGSGEDKPMSKTVVFVVDQSGSMSGDKIDQARNAAKFVIQNLKKDDLFNIVRYESTVTAMAPELQRFDDASRESALGFINGINAGGSTNINEALQVALKMIHDKSRPNYVVFLTDGLPTVGETNELRINENTKAANAMGARIISFGVGYDVNSRLLDRLTRENHGQSEYVRPDEDIEAAVAKLYQKISLPVLANMNVKFEVAGASSADGEATNRIYPAGVTDIFENTQLVMIGRYRKGGSTKVKINGTVGDQKKDFEFDLQLADRGGDQRYAFVRQLWAGRRIGEIIDLLDLKGRNQELIDELIALSTKNGIVTPYTSYLADENANRNQLTLGESNRARTVAQLADLDESAGDKAFGQRMAKQAYKGAENLSQSRAAGDSFQVIPGNAPTPSGGGRGGRPGVSDESKLSTSNAPAGLIKFGDVTLYRRQNLLVADNATSIDVDKDSNIKKIKKFSDDYFTLVKENTELENQILAQQGVEDLLIVLRGQVYLIN